MNTNDNDNDNGNESGESLSKTMGTTYIHKGSQTPQRQNDMVKLLTKIYSES